MADHATDEARTWDEFYAAADTANWSGRPNGPLVAEVADLSPGTALDVGCGEGADAIWLARQGWQVTGIDPSRVALDRAGAAARAAGVEVTWVPAGLLDMPARDGGYDLVTAHYAVLRRTDDDAAIRALLEAVVPGGTLLVVHHELDPAHAADHGPDPTELVMPADVAARLDDDWAVEVHETRPSTGAAARGGRHPSDLVLRARRRRGTG